MTVSRVFLSFASKDVDRARDLVRLVGSLNGQVDFYFQSWHPPFYCWDAESYRRVIGCKIREATATICVVGDKTWKSDWVDWELRTSIAAGHEVAAMALNGIERIVTPSVLKEYDIPVWAWDPERLAMLMKQMCMMHAVPHFDRQLPIPFATAAERAVVAR